VALMRPTAGLMPQVAALVRRTARHCAAMGLEPRTARLCAAMMGMKPQTALYCAAMGLEPQKPRRGAVAA
jgi:hypothetical protein